MVSRRTFLVSSGLAVGGFVIGLGTTVRPTQGKAAPTGQLDGWIHIAADDTITITLNRTEMGQGISTSLPMIVAEELEADWRSIQVQTVSTRRAYDGAITLAPATGGSASIRTLFTDLSEAGAVTRELLREAAAREWGVAVEDCTAENGQILHKQTGRTLSYGELVDKVSTETTPTVTLKQPESYRILGQPTNRLDNPRLVDGMEIFGTDFVHDDMLVGAILPCPIFGGTLASVDLEPALTIPGIVDVIEMERAVIVVADTYWRAQKAADQLAPEWEPPSGDATSTDDLWDALNNKLNEPGVVAKDDGHADSAFSQAEKIVEAIYQSPHVAQAPMEPLNATAWAHDGEVDIWLPTQLPAAVLGGIAQQFDIPMNKITVHLTAVGGGFGRRLSADYAPPAVAASLKTGRPVKVLWSREADLSEGYYRPAALCRMRAAIDNTGTPIAWHTHVANTSSAAQRSPGGLGNKPDTSALRGAADMPYAVSNLKVTNAHIVPVTPLGAWRSVAHSNNAFFVECFLDELAVETDRDPIELRRALLASRQRYLDMLDKVVEVTNWTNNLPRGHDRGFAMHNAWDTLVAMTIDVSQPSDDHIKFERVTAVVDCGIAVNPRGIEAQIEGAVVYGLTAACFGEITFKDGIAVERNYDTYRMLILGETPPIDVHIVKSSAPVGGIGESGVPPTIAACANAVSRATGKRIRRLPLTSQNLTV